MASYRKRINSAGVEYWQITWRENGKAFTKSAGRVAGGLRESEVKELARRKDRELVIAQNAPQIADAGQHFDDYVVEYLAWHAGEYPHSHNRIAQIIEQHIAPHFDMLLTEIEQVDVERFKAARLNATKPKPAVGTIIKEMRTLRAMLNRAVSLGLLTRNVCDSVKPPKQLDSKRVGFAYFSADEMTAIYSKGCVEEWHRHAWRFFAGTGARRGEGLALKWSEVGVDKITLISTGEERTKSGHARDVPISTGAAEALHFFRTWELKSDLYVLPRVTPESLSRIAARCIRRAGLTGSLHTFRHTFITHLAKNPLVPIHAIKEWSGHSTIAVTEQYIHHRPSATDDFVRSLSL
ncbi:MAG: site-specific integrase [Rhodocyclaceae bacterium]|nr:site-specific integrase [Rhodocyclaceae bacterium]